MGSLVGTPVLDNFVEAVTLIGENDQDWTPAILPALQFEDELRQRFVNETLSNPCIGLLDVFNTPPSFRSSRPRPFPGAADFNSRHLFPLPIQDRRIFGSPCCVENIDTFKHHWNIFTHGVLAEFTSWDHVVVAGGSVLAALVKTGAQTDRELAQHYHSDAYSSADVDLFLWGLSPSEAEEKIVSIFEAVKASDIWDVVALRKANVISIHTQFPKHHVQIILRLYQSPAEILVGFDVDCCSACFDGDRVWATPRAMASIISQSLTIDATRRSPSYEMRLFKYVRRGFEISYPALRRNDIDENLYDPHLAAVPNGLARLIVLEQLVSFPDYYHLIFFRGTTLRVNISPRNNYIYRTIEVDGGGFTSNYDYKGYQVPYALKWNAKRVKKLAKWTEKMLSSTYSLTNRNRYLHRHAMIARDDIRDCFKDFCLTCPHPRNREELLQQKEDDSRYIRGRLEFMTVNPGQQRVSGSFRPLDDHEWEVGAYDLSLAPTPPPVYNSLQDFLANQQLGG